MEAEARPTLHVSIVVYRPDHEELGATVASLRRALDHARDAGLLDRAGVWLVDNGSEAPAALDHLVREAVGSAEWLRLEIVRGQGNVGYGRAHNLAIAATGGTYHLVLNPDVVLAPDAIAAALRYLRDHPEVGMVTPHVVWASGERQFLCKRMPSVLVLALRGFAPGWLRRPFRQRLERYEMRDLPEHAAATGIPIASGCFMFARGDALRRVGGFSPSYFLYFEDFDLSLRFGRLAPIAYVPEVRVVHAGGHAARKGWVHQRLFIRSAITFFGTHGWRWW